MTGYRRKPNLPILACAIAFAAITLHIVQLHANVENLQGRIAELQNNETLRILVLHSIAELLENISTRQSSVEESVYSAVMMVLEKEQVIRHNRVKMPRLIHAAFNCNSLGGGE